MTNVTKHKSFLRQFIFGAFRSMITSMLSHAKIFAMVTTTSNSLCCPICLEENARDLVTLTCKHFVCRPCFLRLIFVPNAFTKCPMCRSVISLGKLFKKGKEFQRLSWITVYDQFKARSLWRPRRLCSPWHQKLYKWTLKCDVYNALALVIYLHCCRF